MRKPRICIACGQSVSTACGRFIVHGNPGICGGSGALSKFSRIPPVPASKKAARVVRNMVNGKAPRLGPHLSAVLAVMAMCSH